MIKNQHSAMSINDERKVFMNKIGITLFIVVISAGIAFSGCASTIPITDNIIRDAGGVDNTPLFQYYVSKTITLDLVDANNSVAIEGGQLVKRSATARKQITIQGSLPGLVRRHSNRSDDRRDLDPRLNVAFENYEGDPVLYFGKYRVGSEERYHILYADYPVVIYGNDRYTVSYSGDDPPYLLIKMQQSSKSTKSSRRASGLKLE
jgi:hypothetical protein